MKQIALFNYMFFAALSLFAASAKRPNIMIILSDDMGFSDLSCYGGEIQTPNLDPLSATGNFFTQIFNKARRCPSPASLLTGHHTLATAGCHMTQDKSYDGYPGQL